jgi:hypothetical protein
MGGKDELDREIERAAGEAGMDSTDWAEDEARENETDAAAEEAMQAIEDEQAAIRRDREELERIARFGDRLLNRGKRRIH